MTEKVGDFLSLSLDSLGVFVLVHRMIVGTGQGSQGYGRRNSAECEFFFSPNWRNESFLYTEAFVKCNLILLMYSGRKKPLSQKGASEMMMGRYPSSCCGHLKVD